MKRRVDKPSSGQSFRVINADADQLVLTFEAEEDMVSVSGTNLIFHFNDGTEVVVEDFVKESLDEMPEIELVDGSVLSAVQFLMAYEPQVFDSNDGSAILSGNIGSYADYAGLLIGSLDRSGMLDPFYWSTEYHKSKVAGQESSGLPDTGINIAGVLVAAFQVFEDGQPNKYMLASGADPATGPADHAYQAGYDPVTGLAIDIALQGAAPDVFVYRITLGALPQPAEGTIFFQGEPVTEGQTFTNPDLSGFSFRPNEYYSGDVNFNFSYVLASPATGPATSAKNGSIILHVDSVADLPDAESQATGRTESPEDLEMAAPINIGDGWAMQTIAEEDSVPVTFTVEAEFFDLDGSEQAYIQIKLPTGFFVPEGSDYMVISTPEYDYIRVPVPPLAGGNGTMRVPVTLVMDQSAVAGTKDLEISVVAHERDGLSDAYHLLNNNSAIRVIDQDAEVELLNSSLAVKIGWTYENGNGGEKATADISEIGLDTGSKTVVGAPIIFELGSGSLGGSSGTVDGGTITISPAAGTLYYSGTALAHDGSGTYTLSAAQMRSGALSFVPAANYRDDDIPVSYSVNVTDSRNQQFAITGDTIAVVDAVADKGVIYGPVSGIFQADQRTLDVTVAAIFPDYVSGENHYILVEYNDGWICNTPHEIITVYYDSSGNAIQPSSVISGPGGDYGYNLGNVAYSIKYFCVDVTGQSEQAQGSPHVYTVQLVPPAGLSDTAINVGTMSKVPVSELSGTEYDRANNVIVETTPLEVQFVDPSLLITPEAAYEDHLPEQHQGQTAPAVTDGTLAIALESSHDSIDISDGAIITITFDYAGTGNPGSFTGPYNQEYVFGVDDYIEVAPGKYQLTLQANILPYGSNGFALRYNPPKDDDIDLANIEVTIPAIAAGSGNKEVVTGTLDKLVVDAVADKPADVDGNVIYDGNYTAAVSGEMFTIQMQATFGDYTDGSEQHFLVFDLASGFSSIDVTSFPSGFSVAGSAELSSLGLDLYANDNYVVVRVPNEYLKAHNGVFDKPIRAGADEVREDTALTLDYIAVAVDEAADQDVKSGNNIAYTPGSSSLEVHTITSNPLVDAETAYENDMRLEHIGLDGSNGAPLSISGIDASEAIASITFSFNAESGFLASSDSAVSGPITPGGYTLSNGLTLVCISSGGTCSITISGGSQSADIAAEVGKLSFFPAVNYSDADVPVTVTGTIVDVASGMTGGFGPQEVTIIVDAVAQQPANVNGSVTYDPGFTAAYDRVAISATANFRDTSDSSEKHYLIIEAKSYFDAGGMQLVTIAFDKSDNALTPSKFGSRWFKPNPSGGTDSSTTPAYTKEFIQIPVDSAISQYNTFAGGPQTFGDFTVTLESDGSYTVSWSGEIKLDASLVASDIQNENILTGGMAAESAKAGLTTPAGGEEAYQYNNTSYSFSTKQISVAVVETKSLSLYANFATEGNVPAANNGNYAPANGGGILVVRETPDTQNYSDEQVTVTFGYDAVYQDGSGWVLPGDIYYNGQKADSAINPATGRVTVTLTINASDANSIKDLRDIPNDPDARALLVDESDIRFVPTGGTFNESDVNLSYEFRVTDISSGAAADLPGGSTTVVIDAVAHQPSIENISWDFGNPDYTAASGTSITLQMAINFPDTGTDGVFSEKHFVLVEKIIGMDLDPAFKAAVAQAGYNITDYVVSSGSGPAGQYYRIPAQYFTGGSERQEPVNAKIGMVVSGGINGDINTPITTPRIMAQAIVSTPHGGEPVSTNNESLVEAAVPPLTFAVVDTTVSGGQSMVYEDDTPNAHKGDYTPAGGVRFSLGINAGTTLDGGSESVSDVTFTYSALHGELSYHDGTNWVYVPDGGAVPAEYCGSLRYIPQNTHDSTADIDQLLHYNFAAIDPASGASKTFDGDYKIVVDAVADKPILAGVNNIVYNDSGNGYLYHNQDVTITVTLNFPHWEKTADGHSKNYALIQVPGEMWTSAYPGADIYTINGEPYFRFPVNPADIDSSGNVTLNLVLHTPPSGYLFTYQNLNTFKVGALSIDRDPSFSSSSGDIEPVLTNNAGFADTGEISFNFDPGEYKYMHIDPMYENNEPNANLLDENGNPIHDKEYGTVHLPPVIMVDDGTGALVPEDVDYVELSWDTGKGDLYVNGVKQTPDSSGKVHIDSGDFGNVYFELNEDFKDADFGTVHADVHTTQGNTYGDSSSPIVDAVAQVPANVSSSVNYGEGNTALPPGESVEIEVEATFHDLDGSEEHYVLVEYDPAHWSNPGAYNTILGPDGKIYFQVPVNADDIDDNGNAKVTVTLPPPTGGTVAGPNGEVEYSLGTGAMSVQNPTDGEVRADNNESFNISDTVTITTSGAESNPLIHTSDAYANSDIDGDGAQDFGGRANIWIDGLNAGSDTIPKVTLSYSKEHGEIVYNDAPLAGMPGVTETVDANGNATLAITNPDVINALLSGSAGSSAVQYVPDGYYDKDVTVNGSIVVDDVFSDDTKTVSNSSTITVDAVARHPEDAGLAVTDPNFNGSVTASSSIPFTATGKFPDLGNNADCNHYLAIEQLSGWEVDGPVPPGVFVASFEGTVYYVIDVDAYGSGGSSALAQNPDGSYSFTLNLKSPPAIHDQIGVTAIKGGAITTASNNDGELTFDNNTSIIVEEIPLNIAVVETTEVDFVFAPVIEDYLPGTPITISDASKNGLASNNEKVTDTNFTFSGDFSNKNPGDVVGTIVYDGKAYPVTVTDGNTATASVNFGASGYDGGKDFYVVWGEVQTDGSGNVMTDGSGNPIVTGWNHSGSDMSVSSSSSVVDIASNDTGTASGGGAAGWVPTADPPSNLDAQDPPRAVGAGEEVTFTVSGHFEDVDGSEEHYFLVEQQDGWTGDYDTIEADGKTYFLVPVPGGQSDPVINVTLTTPENTSPPPVSDSSVTLEVSGAAVDGDSIKKTPAAHDTTVNIELAVVNAEGVDLILQQGTINEDAYTQMTFALNGGDNDSITSIVIADLQGGSIVDQNGDVLFADAPAALDVTSAMSGNYYYKPPAYASGNFYISYEATVTDNASGVNAIFSQSGGITVDPVTNMPHDPAGADGAPTPESGHQASVTVDMQAVYDDNDGSEEHFFLVSLPSDITPPAGWTPETDAALTAASGMSGTVYRVAADSGGKASFNVTVPQNYGGNTIIFKAGAVEQGTGDYKFSDFVNVTLPSTGPVNLAPDAMQSIIDVNLTNTAASGGIPLSDPDDDPVNMVKVTVNGAEMGTGSGTYTGLYGTLVLNNDGTFTYTKGSGTGQDKFGVTVSDGFTTSTSYITANASDAARRGFSPNMHETPESSTGPETGITETEAVLVAEGILKGMDSAEQFFMNGLSELAESSGFDAQNSFIRQESINSELIPAFNKNIPQNAFFASVSEDTLKNMADLLLTEQGEDIQHLAVGAAVAEISTEVSIEEGAGMFDTYNSGVAETAGAPDSANAGGVETGLAGNYAIWAQPDNSPFVAEALNTLLQNERIRSEFCG